MLMWLCMNADTSSYLTAKAKKGTINYFILCKRQGFKKNTDIVNNWGATIGNFDWTDKRVTWTPQ